jgi:hypothetical protein
VSHIADRAPCSGVVLEVWLASDNDSALCRARLCCSVFRVLFSTNPDLYRVPRCQPLTLPAAGFSKLAFCIDKPIGKANDRASEALALAAEHAEQNRSRGLRLAAAAKVEIIQKGF